MGYTPGPTWSGHPLQVTPIEFAMCFFWGGHPAEKKNEGFIDMAKKKNVCGLIPILIAIRHVNTYFNRHVNACE